MKLKLVFTAFALCAFLCSNAQGLVGKLKQKASQAADKALEKKVDEKTGTTSTESSDQSQNSDGNANTNSGSRPQNKGGGGLVSTPPDVNQNLSDAETSFKSGSYGEARYAAQQAMLGVEMEIGQQVLKSLPESVNGLAKVAESDQVTSTGYGWAGLTIQRIYNKDDKELKATIANNSAMMAGVNAYLAGGYSQSTNGQQNWKQTKVKGYKAIIEYDESSGYKLTVPLGQSSMIVWEGVNFANEQEMMTAANAFDIDGIKKMLGEQ
jgi:hypothetical protein